MCATFYMKRWSRQVLRACCGGVLLVAWAATYNVALADPVEDLRQALQISLREQGDPTQLILDYRREIVQKRIDALRTIGDLRRALALDAWKDDPSRVVKNLKLSDLDASLRRQVGERLNLAIRDIVKNGDEVSRQAVAGLLTEMGPSMRSINQGDMTGYARGLTPEVIELTRNENLKVRQEALRALGNIFPRPADALRVFERTLKEDNVGARRMAAYGLGQMVYVVNLLYKTGQSLPGVKATRQDVIDTLATVLGTVAPGQEKDTSNDTLKAGLEDSDPEVRIASLKAVKAVAQSLADLTDLVLVTVGKADFPPEGRKLSEAERDFIMQRHAQVQALLKELQGVLAGMRAQGPRLGKSLEDDNVKVQLEAIEALENIGNARAKLKRLVTNVPIVEPADKFGDLGNREAMKKFDTLQLFISKHLATISSLLDHGESRVRRGAMDFLETIEEAAAPALPRIAQSLTDSDRFVRWSAARLLGNFSPDKAAFAVLGLARLLDDPDLNVRLAATKALENLGTLSADAVPALSESLNQGDVEGRVEAMYALQAIGAKYGKVAVPNLITALIHADPRVRKTAAETLGRFGAYSTPAVPALRRLLSDDDQDVRIAASDALLSILQKR